MSQKKVYELDGHFPEDVDPKAVAECLKAIAEGAGGHLLPAMVVAAAESPYSPLHLLFNWDVTDAARRWREHQAGDLIRRVKIRMIGPDPTQQAKRVWVNTEVESINRKAYVEVDKAMHDDAMWASVIKELLRYLAGARRRAEQLTGEDTIARDIARLEQRVERRLASKEHAVHA